jgi:RNA polymerase sigma-70 factor (sigma-E family)
MAEERPGMVDRRSYSEFVTARSERLLRTAFLLTRDWATAEDLLQEAMARAWFAWDRVRDPEPYVRKVIVTTYITWWRRRRWCGEVPAGELPEDRRPDDRFPDDEIQLADQRDAVWRALARLPAHQRAVIVLRFYEDLTEVQAAEALGCSVGTIKSQASRALARLRVDDSLAPAEVRSGELT